MNMTQYEKLIKIMTLCCKYYNDTASCTANIIKDIDDLDEAKEYYGDDIGNIRKVLVDVHYAISVAVNSIHDIMEEGSPSEVRAACTMILPSKKAPDKCAKNRTRKFKTIFGNSK